MFLSAPPASPSSANKLWLKESTAVRENDHLDVATVGCCTTWACVTRLED